MPNAASSSKMRWKRLFCGVALRRASASPRERIAILWGRDGPFALLLEIETAPGLSMITHSSLGESCAELGRRSPSEGEPAHSPYDRVKTRRLSFTSPAGAVHARLANARGAALQSVFRTQGRG